MGVPSFFRWLQRKYPSIIVNANEEKSHTIDGTKIPIDNTKPNVNNQEFDNLYLDMNGIIHPCTHPENRPPPKTEEEMFELIFEYIDRLFSIVRPRRVLYMAIDGVAPRAKMNQQRSRRFRAAKEAIEKEELIQKIRDKLENEGVPLPPKKKAEEKFDSNCITPGTPFMDRLAIALRYYVHNRVTLDPAWENIQVILSDANVPGEGEHKIMDFIRRQRSSPEHDPNTVHCLCGADADLIMLGLATHENNFNIIREEFVPNQPRPCELCHQYGHELKACQGLITEAKGEDDADPLERQTNFIFIKLPALREYLERELCMENLPFPFDLERAIDDWVFMCFFVGNDFLPHLPSLEIREGAIDRLVRLYKQMVYRTGGWLTDAGHVNMKRIQIMMEGLGQMEDDIFRRRKAKEDAWNRQKGRMPKRKEQMPKSSSILAPYHQPPNAMTAAEFKEKRKEERIENSTAEKKLKSLLNIASGSKEEKTQNLSSEEKLKKLLQISQEGKEEAQGKKRRHEESTEEGPPEKYQKTEATEEVTEIFEAEEDDEPLDDIRLYEPGWKGRYYQTKFGVDSADVDFRRQVARDYVEGLCWVLHYYYQGCASWDWYYPHHYAPFASDFDKIADFKQNFPKDTKPFNPLEQLMAVFPAASKSHIPEAWHKLMTEPDSPLIQFYPPDFDIDLNGKKFAWQGVALLPFVDQLLLLGELRKVYDQLTDDEKARNIRGTDRIFISSSHKLFNSVLPVYTKGKQMEACQDNDDSIEDITHINWVDIDPKLTKGMAGSVAYDRGGVAPDGTYNSFSTNEKVFPDLYPNKCLMLAYRDPQYNKDHIYPAKRLDGIIEIEKTLKPLDHRGPYRPNVGFTRDRDYAHLEAGGHRMVQFHSKNGQNYQQQEFTGYIGYFAGNEQYNNQRNNNYRKFNKQPPPPAPSFADMAMGQVPYYGGYNDNHQSRGRGRGGNSYKSYNSHPFNQYNSGQYNNGNYDNRRGGYNNNNFRGPPRGQYRGNQFRGRGHQY